MTVPRIPGTVVICGPDPAGYRKRYVRCPTDQCITEMVAHYSLYGDTLNCCRCGDAWCDGEMYPRPFERGWRAKAVARHRALWDRATHGPASDVCAEFVGLSSWPDPAPLAEDAGIRVLRYHQDGAR